MNCIVVDDDKAQQLLIGNYIKKTAFLELGGVCSDAAAATGYLTKNDIDLIFLDIELPDMSGFELLDSLDNKPLVIFISAKESYAMQAFDFPIVDYLVKPVAYPRFMKAVARANALFHSAKRKNSWRKGLHPGIIFVKEGTDIVRLEIEKILFIQAYGDYIIIHLSDGKKKMVLTTMRNIEEKLSADTFIRVHRSYIVNLMKIDRISDNVIQIGDTTIPVSKSGKALLSNSLQLLGK